MPRARSRRGLPLAAALAAAALTLLCGAAPSLATEPQPLSPTARPWYRGDADSKLRLRYDFGAGDRYGVVLKGPGKRDRLAELRFVIRF